MKIVLPLFSTFHIIYYFVRFTFILLLCIFSLIFPLFTFIFLISTLISFLLFTLIVLLLFMFIIFWLFTFIVFLVYTLFCYFSYSLFCRFSHSLFFLTLVNSSTWYGFWVWSRRQGAALRRVSRRPTTRMLWLRRQCWPTYPYCQECCLDCSKAHSKKIKSQFQLFSNSKVQWNTA